MTFKRDDMQASGLPLRPGGDMVSGWFVIASVLVIFCLGSTGADVTAVPLGSALLWMLTLASGRLEEIFTLPCSRSGTLKWLELLIGSASRCLILASVDFELGRIIASVAGIGTD